MKNATTAAEGEEKTYMKPNIHIQMYLNTWHIPIQQSTEQSPKKKHFIWLSRYLARKY